MNEPTIWQQILLLLRELLPWFALAGSGVGIYLAVKKQPFDIRNLDGEAKGKMADVAEKYQKIANEAADANIKLREEIQSVRERLEEVQAKYAQELAEIRAALERAEIRAAKFEDWAHRLVAQIESLGEKPVPFEPKTRNPTQPRRD